MALRGALARLAVSSLSKSLLIEACFPVAVTSLLSAAAWGGTTSDGRCLHALASGAGALALHSGVRQGWQQQQHHLRRQQQGQLPLILSPLQQQCGQVRHMFIQTQPTPNPQSLMFLPGRPVMESGSYEFSSARAAMASPLAKRLFRIDGVTGVFFGSDFVTVTKREDMGWPLLKPDVFAALADHYASGEPLFSDADSLAASDTAIHEDDDEVVALIKELLETRIRPAVQEDGGDIVYRGFDVGSGTVTLKMMGACSGCPSSAVTLKSGIENMLMHYVPEVKQVVEAPPDDAEEEGLRALQELDAALGEGQPQQQGAAGTAANRKSGGLEGLLSN